MFTVCVLYDSQCLFVCNVDFKPVISVINVTDSYLQKTRLKCYDKLIVCCNNCEVQLGATYAYENVRYWRMFEKF